MRYEWVDCYSCGGSGEGMVDGSSCGVCRGRGDRLIPVEEDDEHEDAEDSQTAVDE